MTDTTESPTALDLPSVDPLPPRTRKYFEICEEKLGLVPNVLRAYAFDPEKLDAFSAMYNELMLGDSGLTKLEREMIAVVVSAINRCHYCVVAHGASVRQLSDDSEFADTLAINYRLCRLNPRQRAMLDFAALLTESSFLVEETDRQRLREAGFSDRDIWDIGAVAAFFNMTNRLASATAMEPNREYYGLAR
ncbi:MAG: peroxidase-related enzyme [Rhodobacteraceae bacterium]|nr:peroxidase-related enzyme [Paracoccaceae bacterium]